MKSSRKSTFAEKSVAVDVGQVNFNEHPQKELAKFSWLLNHQAITKSEFEEAKNQILSAISQQSDQERPKLLH